MPIVGLVPPVAAGGCVVSVSSAQRVVAERGHLDFNDYFDKQWKQSRFEELIAENNVRTIPRYSEQADAVKDYKERFGESPKIQGYLTYRVIEKAQ